MTDLRSIGQDIWVSEQPLSFYGLDVGARMTVVRLRSGGTWVHSPVRATPELRAAVDAIGPVRAIVAPNRYHHLFAGDWADAYPGAELHVAKSLKKKRADLKTSAELGDEAPSVWAEDLQQARWRGMPLFDETVFLHPASRTLILSDIAHNLGPETPALTRLVFRIIGAYPDFGAGLFERMAVRDRAAVKTSFERVLTWDFDRVVVAHGNVREGDGKTEFARTYGWL